MIFTTAHDFHLDDFRIPRKPASYGTSRIPFHTHAFAPAPAEIPRNAFFLNSPEIPHLKSQPEASKIPWYLSFHKGVPLPMPSTQNTDLRHIPNSELLTRTAEAAQKEKAMTLELLKHLHEIERRRLFAERAYSSLWEYVHKGLGYSEAQASERVNAMRLMFSVPEAREKIESGALSLTSASRLHRFFKTEKKHFAKSYTPEQKLELVSKCAGHSKCEVEKILLAHAPSHVALQETQKQITPEHTELRFAISEATRAKLEQVQNIQGALPLGEIFDQALDSYLKALQKCPSSKKAENPTTRVARPDTCPGTCPGAPADTSSRESHTTTAEPNAPRPNAPESSDSDSERRALIGYPQTRYIPAQTRAAVLERSEGRCEFRDPETGRRCESRFRLQFEHNRPYALDGTNSPANILHFCPAHNQFEAVRKFGVDKISRYVPGLN